MCSHARGGRRPLLNYCARESVDGLIGTRRCAELRSQKYLARTSMRRQTHPVPQPTSEGPFSPKRIAITLSAIAVAWLVFAFTGIPAWVLGAIAILGALVIGYIALYVALPSIHIERAMLVWQRRDAATKKIPVSDIVSIEGPRFAAPEARQLRVRGRGGVEIVIDHDVLDPRQVAIVLARLREMRPDLVVPDLLAAPAPRSEI